MLQKLQYNPVTHVYYRGAPALYPFNALHPMHSIQVPNQGDADLEASGGKLLEVQEGRKEGRQVPKQGLAH